jgi:hypothetical protein
MKKKIFTAIVFALAGYGVYTEYKRIKAKGGVLQAYGLKK